MNKSKIYALLASVGNYQKTGKTDLPCYAQDLETMRSALMQGLKAGADNIRSLGEDGEVTTRSFARAIGEFEPLLRKDDTFIFYFSGHGQPEELLFSDGAVTIRSIISYVCRLQAKSKVVILDCCYSGGTKTPSQHLTFEETAAIFAGSGIAVMASSAEDGSSWAGDGGRCSLFTKAAATAILSRRNIREGKLLLSDINEEIRYLMAVWNRNHFDRAQHPVFRDSMLGTIAFDVEEYRPYIPQKITLETEDYILREVRPLSTGRLKRFAAFVITKTDDDTLLPAVTKEIAGLIKNSDVYASITSEQRFKGKTADAIWCYFGHDEADIERSTHFAYTIWAEKKEMHDLYFREDKNAEVVDGIYVYWNTSYGLVKELQKTDLPEEQILADYRSLEKLLIGKAEEFRRAADEIDNGTVCFDDVRAEYCDWIRDVRNLFFKLTDVPPAPLSSGRWAEAVLDLAGWVVDLSVYLEKIEDWESPGNRWMMRETLKRYLRSLNTLCEMENFLTSDG